MVFGTPFVVLGASSTAGSALPRYHKPHASIITLLSLGSMLLSKVGANLTLADQNTAYITNPNVSVSALIEVQNVTALPDDDFIPTDLYNWTIGLNISVEEVNGQYVASSVASLSWPAGQSPDQPGAAWNSCVFAITSDFTPLASPSSDGSCYPVFGRNCTIGIIESTGWTPLPPSEDPDVLCQYMEDQPYYAYFCSDISDGGYFNGKDQINFSELHMLIFPQCLPAT
jgi:hypothetical protein